MKLHRILFFALILPLTLILDIILFNLTRACPTCGSFSQFIQTEGALSFPLVVGFMELIRALLASLQGVPFKDKT